MYRSTLVVRLPGTTRLLRGRASDWRVATGSTALKIYLLKLRPPTSVSLSFVLILGDMFYRMVASDGGPGGDSCPAAVA